MKTKLLFVLILTLTCSWTLSAQSEADRIVGYYVSYNEKTGKENSQIQIFKGANGKYHGKIIWLAIPNENGKPKVDDENPDKALQSRPILGLLLLKNFTFNSKTGEWDSGTIYSPDEGKTYNCFMKFDGDKTLKIRGFIGASWMGLGKTVKWTKESTPRK